MGGGITHDGSPMVAELNNPHIFRKVKAFMQPDTLPRHGSGVNPWVIDRIVGNEESISDVSCYVLDYARSAHDT